jgi:hypothetical protein
MQALVPARDAAAPPPATPPKGKNAFAMLLRERATWAIIIANFVNHFNYFIYLNWMPMYFNKVIPGAPAPGKLLWRESPKPSRLQSFPGRPQLENLIVDFPLPGTGYGLRQTFAAH